MDFDGQLQQLLAQLSSSDDSLSSTSGMSSETTITEYHFGGSEAPISLSGDEEGTGDEMDLVLEGGEANEEVGMDLVPQGGDLEEEQQEAVGEPEAQGGVNPFGNEGAAGGGNNGVHYNETDEQQQQQQQQQQEEEEEEEEEEDGGMADEQPMATYAVGTLGVSAWHWDGKACLELAKQVRDVNPGKVRSGWKTVATRCKEGWVFDAHSGQLPGADCRAKYEDLMVTYRPSWSLESAEPTPEVDSILLLSSIIREMMVPELGDEATVTAANILA